MFGGSYLRKGWHLQAILGGGVGGEGGGNHTCVKNQFCVCVWVIVCVHAHIHVCVCIFVQ